VTALAGVFALVLLLPTLACATSSPALLEGRVVAISDGDTLTLLVDERPVKIRLAQIDAPEMRQPYGRRAKAALSDYAFGKPARVEVVDVDDYGRSVGEVYVDGVHVNFEMVRQGHAWAYTRYARGVEIVDLENEARAARRGLWRLPEEQRDPPWVWRHRGRRSRLDRQRLRGAHRQVGEVDVVRTLEELGLTRPDRDPRPPPAPEH
jgi:endonuclease YncB( thermonuclease family)